MFLPQTQQPHLLNRSYGAPGTARRGGRDKENAGVLPSKTPVRAPLAKGGPSTAGRPLGAKTPGMLGKTPNMLGKTPGVLGTKNVERNIMPSQQPADDIEPKRLFRNAKQAQAPAGPSKAHKTPGRGVRTPAPRRAEAPTPAPLPSAQRTRRRSRSSLQQSTPHAWEEEASLDSILEAEIEVPAISMPQEDSDVEVEYAGATAIDRPYVPEWYSSIPDPVQTMAKLAKMPPLMPPFPRSPPSTHFDAIEMPKIQLCSDDELEHPLLRRKPAQDAAPRRPLTSISNRLPSSTTAIPAAKPTSRPGVARLGQSQALRTKTSSSTGNSTRPVSSASARTTTSASARTTTSASLRATTRPGARPPSAASSLRQPGSAAPRLPESKASSRPASTRPASTRPASAGARSASSARPASSTQSAPRVTIPSPEPPELNDELLDLDFGVLDHLDKVDTLPPIELLSLSDPTLEGQDPEQPPTPLPIIPNEYEMDVLTRH